MKSYICSTCGTLFALSQTPPELCPICEDERQYVNWEGQQWTTLEDLRVSHKNTVSLLEPGLIEIKTEPGFGIGQRALLVQSDEGNVLWDCLSLIDDETIDKVLSFGGISAIALSHPHFYASMIEWSRAFGGVPVFIHASDREWVLNPPGSIVYWEGEVFNLKKDLTLINCGGHFEGSSVLHWEKGAEGKGCLMSGDTIQVVMDRRFVSFMRSYPNLIPLSPAVVTRIVRSVENFDFDRIYGAWQGKTVFYDAKNTIFRSAERYIKAVEG